MLEWIWLIYSLAVHGAAFCIVVGFGCWIILSRKMGTCGDCVYWKERDGTSGNCHYDSPKLESLALRTLGGARIEWGERTESDDNCRKWRWK